MQRRLNALIACEFSGVVSGAFRDVGHAAYSCDFLPTEGDPRWHIQGDALKAILDGCPDGGAWDFIGLHYTCTFFTNSGVQWLYEPRTDGNPGRSYERDGARWSAMRKSADELAALYIAAKNAAPKFYFENPTMHGYASIELDQRIPDWSPKPTQTIQPYDFGHPESKKTGLWLHGLPPLVPTKIVRNEMALLPKRESHRVHHASPGKDRWKARSRTLPGIAKAMAEQWGEP